MTGPPGRRLVEPGGSDRRENSRVCSAAPPDRNTRARADREAQYMAELERVSSIACAAQCRSHDKTLAYIRQRLAEMANGSPERFRGERALAEMALPRIEELSLRFDVIYTILAFGKLHDRWRYLLGSDADREAAIRETIARRRLFRHWIFSGDPSMNAPPLRLPVEAWAFRPTNTGVRKVWGFSPGGNRLHAARAEPQRLKPV